MLEQPRDPRDISLWGDVTPDEWDDPLWQLRNRVDSLDGLRRIADLTDDEESAITDARGLFRIGITPHYATLIDPDDPDCPIRLQAIPRMGEFAVADFERDDPLAEDRDSPVPGIVHRYPDRVLFMVTHECAIYCRFCTRRRIVGDAQGSDSALLDGAIDYIARTPSVRDVLLSGGDPLVLSDRRLEDLLSRLRAIEHVEIVRIGTRLPVVLPQRITPELVAMLRRFHPLWLNTHFNHPFELAPPAVRVAMERLADAGIPTGNQTVLLRGVNDCPAVMRRLMHGLVRMRCRPYYLYNCDLSLGLSHFRTPVETGLRIIESLQGHTSGYAIPLFVVDAPDGGGKIPILPNHVTGQRRGALRLRSYNGVTSVYDDSTESAACRWCGEAH